MSGALMMCIAAGYNGTIALSDANVQDITAGGTALAAYRVHSSGLVQEITNTGGTAAINTSTDWWRHQPSGFVMPQAPGVFQVRATLQSGDTPTGGTLDTWLDIADDPTWTLDQTGSGSKSSELLVEIRCAGGTDGGGTPGRVLDSATINLDVTVT